MFDLINLSKPPGYELFFDLLAIKCDFDPNTLESIQFAYVLSKYGHGNQIREGGGRYFEHPKSAAWIYVDELGGRDPEIIKLLLLHDVPEDSYLMSFFRIRLNFGIDLALDLRALTKLKRKKESFADNLDRVIERGPRAIIGKACDRLHNIRTLGGCNAEKQERKIAETVDVLMPKLLPALRSFGGEYTVLADVLEKKLKETISALSSQLQFAF
ncbi:MAG TPA: hypothetical protein DIT25_03485 [Candidatus Moranbacteria bacterium]|nr:hypothetical protein [Candidatus Moranbacteria bacterium]